MVSVSEIQKRFDILFQEIRKVIVGQDQVMKEILVALLCDAHALLESYPGLAKTLAIKTLSQTLDLQFSRIQSTPDLLPADIIGTYIIDESKGKKQFTFQQGPIFANMVLVDEINRATPKSQSALLEAMQERQITTGNNTFKLDDPFFVLATQNPIEQAGTFPLPEAQSDRFLLKIKLTYPPFEDEMEIVERYATGKQIQMPKKVFNKENLKYLQNLTRQVPMSNDLKKYTVSVVTATRNRGDLIEYGASPRASIGLILAAKAMALIEGHKCVMKEDIIRMAYSVLRHRIILTFEAEKNNITEDDVIKELLE
ncbi:MoxR family ATPase [Candidatus Woesearchaeota archaeon]|nr:MoxR family ATPase [Candidatus Woesearchaeota archaeon]